MEYSSISLMHAWLMTEPNLNPVILIVLSSYIGQKQRYFHFVFLHLQLLLKQEHKFDNLACVHAQINLLYMGDLWVTVNSPDIFFLHWLSLIANLIHSARTTVKPVVFTMFTLNLFCLRYFEKWGWINGRTDTTYYK